jgi:ribosomal protein L40E
MDTPMWVYASIAAVALFHLFVLVYLQTRGNRPAADASGAPEPASNAGDAPEAVEDPDGDTVRCRQCGAENERRFRFCRNCVAELPGPSLSEGAGGVSASRGIV